MAIIKDLTINNFRGFTGRNSRRKTSLQGLYPLGFSTFVSIAPAAIFGR
ncbi:MAG: hypothetical protein FWE37_00400 [Spirochaetaceae bacterium]|nr:hypothetical protein [Spirochaetaceae bacterium]